MIEHRSKINQQAGKTLPKNKNLIGPTGRRNHIMVFETVRKLIAERTDKPVEEITLESTFADLGIDSLDSVELLMEMEEELNASLELDQKVETVGELVKFIESKIEQ